jgi:hypothetical protein
MINTSIQNTYSGNATNAFSSIAIKTIGKAPEYLQKHTWLHIPHIIAPHAQNPHETSI